MKHEVDEEKKVEEKNENRQTIQQTVQDEQTIDVVDDLSYYIPSKEDFEGYVERSVDHRLKVHYEIGPNTGNYKYPLTQGKQGTGKTYSHAYYAMKHKLPFFLFSCYEDFRLSKLFGDKTIKNGDVKFQESMFIKAINSPSVILFDEINAISNVNTFDFHALLQNRELYIKDANDGKGKTYKLHPKCRIGFAQNPKSAKYVGGTIKPSNFLGRCTFITYPEFRTDDIVTLIKNKYPMMKQKQVNDYVGYYFGCIRMIETNGLPIDISIRQLMNLIDLHMHGLELKHAIEDAVASMLEAASQPALKDSFIKLSYAVWPNLKEAEPVIEEEQEVK